MLKDHHECVTARRDRLPKAKTPLCRWHNTCRYSFALNLYIHKEDLKIRCCNCSSFPKLPQGQGWQAQVKKKYPISGLHIPCQTFVWELCKWGKEETSKTVTWEMYFPLSSFPHRLPATQSAIQSVGSGCPASCYETPGMRHL